MNKFGFRNADPQTWHPQQRWLDYILRWAEAQGKTFVVEDFEPEEYDIHDMEVVDVWGWLLPNEETDKTEENYGLLQWYMKDGTIKFYWNTDPEHDEGPAKNYPAAK